MTNERDPNDKAQEKGGGSDTAVPAEPGDRASCSVHVPAWTGLKKHQRWSEKRKKGFAGKVVRRMSS